MHGLDQRREAAVQLKKQQQKQNWCFHVAVDCFSQPYKIQKLESEKQHAYKTQEHKLKESTEDYTILSSSQGTLEEQNHKPNTKDRAVSLHYLWRFYFPIQEGTTTLTVPTSNIFIYR